MSEIYKNKVLFCVSIFMYRFITIWIMNMLLVISFNKKKLKKMKRNDIFRSYFHQDTFSQLYIIYVCSLRGTRFWQWKWFLYRFRNEITNEQKIPHAPRPPPPDRFGLQMSENYGHMSSNDVLDIFWWFLHSRSFTVYSVSFSRKGHFWPVRFTFEDSLGFQGAEFFWKFVVFPSGNM